MKNFDDARARLLGIVQNRIVRGCATPMDIGRVGGGKDQEHEDDSINYMNKGGKSKGKGKGACHNCGKPGHFARECPKGKGKGKGFQGACYTCGEYGHSAKDCTWTIKGGKAKGKGPWWKGKGVWNVDEGHPDEGEKIGDIGAVDFEMEPMKIGDPRWRQCTNELSCIDHVSKVFKKEINEVKQGWERIRVQIDSGAVDTVAPKHVARAFKLCETKASRNSIGFVAANKLKGNGFDILAADKELGFRRQVRGRRTARGTPRL